MITLKLEHFKNISYNDFSLMKIDNNKFMLKYKNDNFVIDTEMEFNFCNIYRQNNIYKIKFSLDEKENKYENFIYNINLLYEIISNVINENDDIFVSHVIRPIYGGNIIKHFYVNFKKNTYINDIKNNERLEIDDIKNKSFYIYPILCNPILNLSNEYMYINFYFHSIFMKTFQKVSINIDYKKIKDIMNI